MKANDAAETIAKFFNDLIGAWVPGSVLAFGLLVMHLGPKYLEVLVKLGSGAGVAFTVAGLLFALGHLILAVHENIVKPLLKRLNIWNVFDEMEARNRQSYIWFIKLVEIEQSSSQATWDFYDLRSVALSVSTEAASLGRRFMFISLLCSGVGTALIILSIDYLICLFFVPQLMYSYEQAAPWYIQVILLICAALILFKQGNVFYARAMTTPFSVAIAELKFKKDNNAVAT